MDDFQIVPHGKHEEIEPIADQNFNRKKMLSIEQGIDKLQKTTRQQHEVVANLETNLKSMISEADLRRAIGLAFQEFENRIEDAFQDSNRKCLQMFSKRDEVSELKVDLKKKVNWSDYNAVMKKLSDLRQYIDTMAESVFLGQREALESEFSKKADAHSVEKALKSKADFSDVNDVRARLERLEVLVEHNDAKFSSKFEGLKAEIAEERKETFAKQEAIMKDAESIIANNKQQYSALKEKLEGAEDKLHSLNHGLSEIRKALQEIQNAQDNGMLPRLYSVEDRLSQNETADSQRQEMIDDLDTRLQDLKGSIDDQVARLSNQGEDHKEQLDFLMKATDMIKRRSRETTKANTAKFQELTDDQEKHLQQLAALERLLKKHEREVRAVENRTSKALADTAPGEYGFMRALPPVNMMETQESLDPNNRLMDVLEQLDKIANSGPKDDPAASTWTSSRPPLPVSGATTARDFGATGMTTDQAMDSARNTSTNIRGMYGLSPRTTFPPVGKTAAKKKRNGM
mmetsp:Transcript_99885/g.177790  ORF Transcript_99885/g.177790 Transcript_99885/m.177790 type:complete len:516 (+) Transcript_99885:54-1601(+)